MHIAHGPPGASGVTTLMSVGADDLAEPQISQTARLIGLAGTGVWVYGAATKHRGMKKVGLGVALAAFVVELMSRRG